MSFWGAHGSNSTAVETTVSFKTTPRAALNVPPTFLFSLLFASASGKAALLGIFTKTGPMENSKKPQHIFAQGPNPVKDRGLPCTCRGLQAWPGDTDKSTMLAFSQLTG